MQYLLQSEDIAMTDDIPAPPGAYALLEFMEKVYGEGGVLLDDVEEQVVKLVEHLESDEEQRRWLLEQRDKFCHAQDKVQQLARMLEVLAELVEGEREALLVALASILEVLLAQCTSEWETLPARAKARILAPLYMAIYHLDGYTRTRSTHHVEAAETLALLALARLDETLGRRESRE